MIDKIFKQFSRRKFLGAAGVTSATTLLSSARAFGAYASSQNNNSQNKNSQNKSAVNNSAPDAVPTDRKSVV